jgi:hypothetical protein
MVRCKDFYEKVRRDGNFCGMTKRALKEVEEYITFLDENPALTGISERAAQPLMREKDPEVQAKAIETTGRQLNHRPSPTEAQMKNRIANIAAGKDVKGGNHKGAQLQEEVSDKKFSDYVEPVEVDQIEVIGDDVYPLPLLDDVDKETGDIPTMPIEAVEHLDIGLVPIVDPIEIEEEIEGEEAIKPVILEVTAKTTKENLLNAGHKDEKVIPKVKRAPKEEDKQRLFDKTIEQALEWGIEGDEIFRRTEKAILFALKKSKEET